MTKQDIVKYQKKLDDIKAAEDKEIADKKTADDARFNDRVDKRVKDILEKINADKKKQEEEDATEKAQKKIDADKKKQEEEDATTEKAQKKIDAYKKKQEEDHEIFKRITTIIFLCFILIYMFYYNSISKNDYDSVSILNLT